MLTKTTVALAVLLTTSVALTQSADSQRDTARGHFERGLVLVEQKEFEGALEAFLAAYRASPEPAVLYNIGQTFIALNRPLEAVTALEQYLSESKAELSAERLDKVTRQLATLRAKTAEIAFITRTPGLSLTLDGEELGRTPLTAPVRVAPGVHAVSATGSDGSKLSRSVLLEAGDRLDLRLEPPTPPMTTQKPLAPPEVVRPTPVANAPPRSGISQTTWGYVAGGVGIGLAATAFGHYLWNLGRYDQWQKTHDALAGKETAPGYAELQTENNELASSIESASRVTVSLALGGAALLGTGVTLVVLDGGDRSKASGVALSYGGLF